MDLVWRFSLEGIDWDELSRLYKAAPLGDQKPKDLETSFSNSRYNCFVFSSGKLVGAGRALADGIDCSYICAVAVLPAFQGKGIGKGIVSKLLALSKGHKKIILYANPGREDFYRGLGFKRMSTAMAIFDNMEDAADRGLVDKD